MSNSNRHWHSAFYAMCTAMFKLKLALRQRSMRWYLLGHFCILVGAWLMETMDSMVPMALCSSAALLLSVPLLRQLATRFSRRS